MTYPTTIAERLRRLEDADEIQQVTFRYAEAISKMPRRRQVDAVAIATLFAPDAVWRMEGYGTFEGADTIEAALPIATSRVELSTHAFLNPRIAIEGDTAGGSWLLWIASVIGGQARAVHLDAHITYSRGDAGWRIQTIDIHPGIEVHGSDRT